MNTEFKNQLIKIAKEKIPDTDVSHDFEHALRVLSNAERIAQEENGDLDIIVPAALFHDLYWFRFVISHDKKIMIHYQIIIRSLRFPKISEI